MVMVLMIGFAFEIGNPLTFGVSAKIRQDFAEVKKGVLKQLVLNPTRLCYIYDIRKTQAERKRWILRCHYARDTVELYRLFDGGLQIVRTDSTHSAI